MRLDTIIVGSGAAGVSAAVNLKILNKKFMIFGSRELSPKVQKAEKIRNYIGLPDITGDELKQAMQNHLESMEIEIAEQRINNIYAMGDYFAVVGGSEMYEANSIIIAAGVEFKKPLDGEEALVGSGVSYCATCDGMLYRGKTIAVIGSSSGAEHELDYLAELAKKVFYFPLYPMRENYVPAENVEIITERPEEIQGDAKVERVRTKTGRLVDVSGVFILKDAVSPKELLQNLEVQDGHIQTDRNMATNIPGCFACGDCVGRPYQYMKAAGEGNIAAHSAVQYLANTFSKK